jgi:hypothetical protein
VLHVVSTKDHLNREYMYETKGKRSWGQPDWRESGVLMISCF